MAVVMEKPCGALEAYALLPDYVPWGYKPYRVQNGDNWCSVAAKCGVPVDELIFKNCNTREPKYVNYFLKYKVGCRVVSPDGKNYSFRDASPGIIYIPDRNFQTAPAPVYPIRSFLPFSFETQLQLKAHPALADHLQCAHLHKVHIMFESKSNDATRFVYRQYIRGRVRALSSGSSRWFDWLDAITVPLPKGRPGHRNWSDPTEPVSIHPSEWMEDGEHSHGNKPLRYGYREAPPSFQTPTSPRDEYTNPSSAKPPQIGSEYNLTDWLGIREIPIRPEFLIGKNAAGNAIKKRETLKGLSVELEIKGQVREWKMAEGTAPRVVEENIWKFTGHFEIKEREPLLKIERIDKPPE